MSRARVWIAFTLLCLIWGSSYLFIRVGLRQLTPLGLVALRLLIGAAVITVFAYLRHTDLKIKRPILLRLIVGASINTAVPFLLISWGEVTVSSGLASVLNSTVPIFSVLLAAAVLRDEPLTLPRLGGVAIGFAGVILLLSRDLMHAGIQWSSLAAQAAILLSSVCYAVGAVYARRTLRGVPSMTIATYVVWISAAEITLASLIFSRPAVFSINALTWLSVAWLGALGSATAYMLAYFILEKWGAARYTLVAYMMPVVGLTLGAIFLHEVLDWHILAGSALVVSGVVLASIRAAGAQNKVRSSDDEGSPVSGTSPPAVGASTARK